MKLWNFCGSVKDHMGMALIRDAEKRGLLKPGSTTVEATAGNAGISSCAALSGVRKTSFSADKTSNLVVILPDRGDRYLSKNIY